MTDLKDIWLGILTQNTSYSGTQSPITFILNQGGTDKVHHTIADTKQRDLEKGEANLYRIPSNNFMSTVDPDYLSDSSIRVGIRGDNLWKPEHLIVWGKRNDGKIHPLAFENSISTILSTDRNEGKLSMPLRLIETGDDTTNIQRLLVMMKTSDKKHAGTDSKVKLKIKSPEGYFVNYEFPNTPQYEQERHEANVYFIKGFSTFTKNDLNRDSIILEIKGKDKWLPASFFVFGLESPSDRPKYMVPLVNIENWNMGGLSTDSSEGKTSVTIPLS